jgi:mercuric reductase
MDRIQDPAGTGQVKTLGENQNTVPGTLNLRGENMAPAKNYDLIIIGSGTAGASAATTAAHLGQFRVVMVERGTLWGTCVNYGCIPSKFMLTAAEKLHGQVRCSQGGQLPPDQGLAEILEQKNVLIEKLRRKKYTNIIETLGVEIIRGEASFLSPTELQVGDQVMTAPRFIIATGSSPTFPPLEGLETVRPMTNIEALEPEAIPESLVIVGGRALGLEFAQLYAHLGTKVTLLQRSSRIIPEEEPEISLLMSQYLGEEGIDIRTGVDLAKVAKDGDRIRVSARIEGKPVEFSAEQILFATGRSPDTRGLHPERAGVQTGKDGAVLVDETLRTSTPGIYAAGDVIGEPQLETNAKYGGSVAAGNALGSRRITFDRTRLPHAVFTTPQVAGVGLTEEHARRKGVQVVTRCTRMDVLARSEMMGDARGMIKMVAEAGSLRILGVHICSPFAAEILQPCVLAVHHRLTVEDLIDATYIFPTLTEVIWVCARAFRRDDMGNCPKM